MSIRGPRAIDGYMSSVVANIHPWWVSSQTRKEFADIRVRRHQVLHVVYSVAFVFLFCSSDGLLALVSNSQFGDHEWFKFAPSTRRFSCNYYNKGHLARTRHN